jgi:hypothetical protein
MSCPGSISGAHSPAADYSTAADDVHGRQPTAMTKAKDTRRLRQEGVAPAEIARRLGISRASVYRALA